MSRRRSLPTSFTSAFFSRGCRASDLQGELTTPPEASVCARATTGSSAAFAPLFRLAHTTGRCSLSWRATLDWGPRVVAVRVRHCLHSPPTSVLDPSRPTAALPLSAVPRPVYNHAMRRRHGCVAGHRLVSLRVRSGWNGAESVCLVRPSGKQSSRPPPAPPHVTPATRSYLQRAATKQVGRRLDSTAPTSTGWRGQSSPTRRSLLIKQALPAQRDSGSAASGVEAAVRAPMCALAVRTYHHANSGS